MTVDDVDAFVRDLVVANSRDWESSPDRSWDYVHSAVNDYLETILIFIADNKI